MLTINTVGPTIMDFGSQEQKEFFLPKIVAGDIHFCIGYTEATSGTDLASLQTRAMRDGEEYVINGAKIYTSWPVAPTTYGSPRGRIRTSPSTRAPSPCSSSRWIRPVSAWSPWIS